jgi:hypothetical protein
MRKRILIAVVSLLLSMSAQGQTCSKVVSFALADASGVHPFMGTGNWIGNWVQKNTKKHPDICFSQAPMQVHANYLIVLSQSTGYLTGLDPVVRTDTSTSTTPVSGSGTVRDNYGGMWNYTYDGTATTTTTSTIHENAPYTINSRTIYAYAYGDGGAIISQRYHVYSTKTGGDAANSAGYNIGNALGAINARGRLLNSVVKDIEGQKNDGNSPLEFAKSQQSASATPQGQPIPTQSSIIATLEIVSTPAAAEIQLDGSFVGSTPSTIGAAAGDHVISINKTGYKAWERQIKISSGEIAIAADLEADIKREQKTEAAVAVQSSSDLPALHETAGVTPAETLGTISLTSSPYGAEIYSDSLFVGKTPATLKLKPGQHSIRMFMKDYNNWSQWIAVEAGSEARIAATLKKSN